jgi:hypothetical protein
MTLRQLDFTLWGLRSGEIPRRGTAADLIRSIPYAIVANLIPPRAVMNEVLTTGDRDTVMSGGCRWSPFQLSEDEFDAVVADLTTRPSENGDVLRYEEPPANVATEEEWSLWLASRFHSVPDAENRRLWQAVTDARQRGRDASARGDKAAQARAFAELSVALAKWTALQRPNAMNCRFRGEAE